MFSAAHSTILKEANQRIKISEDYRILELTEQIQGVQYRVVCCFVYSSVHTLGWCVATLNGFVYHPFSNGTVVVNLYILLCLALQSSADDSLLVHEVS
jgi:hypothetical protein